jgi:hypothetical protein
MRFRPVVLCLLCCGLAFAQGKFEWKSLREDQPIKPSKVTFDGDGSFEINGMGDVTFEMNGTLFLVGLKAQKIVIPPTLKLEYGPKTVTQAGKAVERVGYYGKGTVKIIGGEFKKIMYLGAKTKGTFNGIGMCQFNGRGIYKIEGLDKKEWTDASGSIYVPPLVEKNPVNPTGVSPTLPANPKPTAMPTPAPKPNNSTKQTKPAK